MNEATQRLKDLLGKGEKLGISNEAFLQLKGAKKLRHETLKRSCPLLYTTILVLGATLVISASRIGWGDAWNSWRMVSNMQCVVENPDWMQRAFRPPEDCSLCRDVLSVERLANVSPQNFEQRFAYSGRPVVITDATVNWTAPNLFSFSFFKTLYESSPQPGCQFFPYATSFQSLEDVFNMSEQRAAMKGKPWYVGWSNCDERVARVLRQHYTRPYFLPQNAESKQLDWIFMGSPGYGAHMHVDSVGHASWQAQLRGEKQWVLQPPPECIYQCRTLYVTVHTGEIIVLDTNRWYHKTLIVSEEMSITIGAEYD